jgi:hypothetical protein
MKLIQTFRVVCSQFVAISKMVDVVPVVVIATQKKKQLKHGIEGMVNKMKEVTCITTCEIVTVKVLQDDHVIPPTCMVPPYAKLKDFLKTQLDVDDVNVKLVQYFVRDLPNTSEVGVETPETAVQGG